MDMADRPDKELYPLAVGPDKRYFTVWTGWMPLAVFRAENLREARDLAKSDEFLQMLRRATVIGKPLLAYGAKVWVALATEVEVNIFLSNGVADDHVVVWLQDV